MGRLIQANRAATRQGDRSLDAPWGSIHLGATNILRFKRLDQGLEVVAHQVQHRAEQIMAGMALRKLAVQRVYAGFGRWHRENHPAFAHLYIAESEDVAEEGAVGFGIFAVEQKMSADDHAAEYIPAGAQRLTNFVTPL